MNVILAILGTVGVLFAIIAAVYFFAPAVLFDLLRNLLRRRGKLTEKSIAIGGQVWPYLEGGPADGEPVVLVHGFGGEKDNWALYAKFLTGKYRVIAPDLPGFGDNTHDRDGDYTIATQALALRGFLDAMGLDAPHLGGNSMGGFIALRYALDYPDKLRTLTLFNNAGVVGERASDLQKEVEQGRNPLLINSPDDVKRLLSYISYKPQPVPRKFREVAYKRFAKHRDLYDAIFWTIGEDALQHPLTERLPEVTVPTMIIWGRHDQLIDVSCVEVLENGIPDTESVVFEDVGHVPMIEQPAKTAEAQVPFFAKHAI